MTTRQQLEAYGASLRTKRKSMGLTQTELAQKLGLRQTDISQCECGRTHELRVEYTIVDKREATQQLSDFFGIDIPDLKNSKVEE